MIGGMGSAVTPDLSKGGDISGDIAIDGDLSVTGSSSVAVTDVIEGSMIIDATGTETLLIRKNSDGGDVFVVDTTNSKIIVGGAGTFTSGNNASGTIAVLSGNATQWSKIFIGTDTGKATIGVSGSSDAFFTGTAQDDSVSYTHLTLPTNSEV